MRARLALILAMSINAISVVLPAADDTTKPEQSTDVRWAVDDATIISVTLKHFSEQKLWAFKGRESKKTIVIHKESPGPSFELSDAQLQAEMHQEKWAIPNELAENLRKRNEKVVRLDGLQLGDVVLVGDFRKVPPLLDGLKPPAEYARAKAYAKVWLPAYSEDGTTAIVRFLFGPTPHGATATYLLSKKDGTWRVAKWTILYNV